MVDLPSSRLDRIGMDLFSIEREEEERELFQFRGTSRHWSIYVSFTGDETRTKQSEDVSGREVYRAMAVADVMLVGRPSYSYSMSVCIYPVPEELMDRYLRDRVTIKFMQQQ